MFQKISGKIKSNPYYLITVLFIGIRILSVALVLIFAGSDYKKSMLQWDAIWYRNLVDGGYSTQMPQFSPTAPECAKGTDLCQNNTGFFPVYPLIVKGITYTGVDTWSSGFLVSNIFYLAAVLLLFKFVLEIFKDKELAYLSVFAMMIYPASFVFGAYMTESLFIFLFILAYYLAFRKKWFWAAFVGAIMSATRNTGVLFIIPLVMIMIQNKVSKKTYLLNLIIPIGLILFMIFLSQRVGDPFAFYNIQKYFRQFNFDINPLSGFFLSFVDWRNEANILNHLYDLSYFFILIGLFFWNSKKKYIPLSMSIALLWIAIPMISGTTSSLPRFSAVYFPVFILIAYIVKGRKWLKYSFFVMSATLMLFFNVLYLYGRCITS